LKLKCDEPLSKFAFIFNLRRYNEGSGETGCKKESACASNNGGCDALTACVDTGTAAGSSCGPCPTGYVGDGTSGCVDYDACAAEPCAEGVHCEDNR